MADRRTRLSRRAGSRQLYFVSTLVSYYRKYQAVIHPLQRAGGSGGKARPVPRTGMAGVVIDRFRGLISYWRRGAPTSAVGFALYVVVSYVLQFYMSVTEQLYQ
jgi:hypothetical protein